MPSVANVEVGIVADDLTGALDSAAAFCAPGARVTVELWPSSAPEPAAASAGRPPSHPSVVSIAAATRDLPAAHGEPLLRGALASIHARSPRRLLLKVDSQLRGHPARDVAVALSESPDPRTLAIVAPAFPGHGRTSVGGIHRVHKTDAGIAIPALFEAVGLPTAHIGLELVRGGDLASAFARLQDAGVRVAVVDAETDDDLRAIARADSPATPVLWVGSAGLAAALAALSPSGRAAECGPMGSSPGSSSDSSSVRAGSPRNPARILVVAGSASPQTARQVAALVDAGAAHVVVPGDLDGDEFEAGIDSLRTALNTNSVVVLSSGVGSAGTDGHDGRWAAILANTTARTIAGRPEQCAHVDGIVFSGGETMVATCRTLGIHSLEVLGEGELGVPHSVSRGSLALPIISKAGAFGDDETLVRAVCRLDDSIRNHDGGNPTDNTTGTTEGASR